jgi:hypothetical protein
MVEDNDDRENFLVKSIFLVLMFKIFILADKRTLSHKRVEDLAMAKLKFQIFS